MQTGKNQVAKIFMTHCGAWIDVNYYSINLSLICKRLNALGLIAIENLINREMTRYR